MGVIDIDIDDIVYCTVVMDGIKAQIHSSSAQGDSGTGVFSVPLAIFIIYLYGIKSVVLYKPISSDAGLILLSSCHLSCGHKQEVVTDHSGRFLALQPRSTLAKLFINLFIYISRGGAIWGSLRGSSYAPCVKDAAPLTRTHESRAPLRTTRPHAAPLLTSPGIPLR